MNEIVKKKLLEGNKFMPETHLRKPSYTHSVPGPFNKNKDRIEGFMPAGNTDYIYKNNLDKACFQHYMAYDEYKGLNKRIQSDKVLRDKAFKSTSNANYYGFRRGLASMVYKAFH